MNQLNEIKFPSSILPSSPINKKWKSFIGKKSDSNLVKSAVKNTIWQKLERNRKDYLFYFWLLHFYFPKNIIRIIFEEKLHNYKLEYKIMCDDEIRDFNIQCIIKTSFKYAPRPFGLFGIHLFLVDKNYNGFFAAKIAKSNSLQTLNGELVKTILLEKSLRATHLYHIKASENLFNQKNLNIQLKKWNNKSFHLSLPIIQCCDFDIKNILRIINEIVPSVKYMPSSEMLYKSLLQLKKIISGNDFTDREKEYWKSKCKTFKVFQDFWLHIKLLIPEEFFQHKSSS